MRIAAFSDTHTFHDTVPVPDADILIFAGEFAYRGDEIKLFSEWWNKLPHQKKILVPGNHDRCLFTNPELIQEMFPGTNVLIDMALEIDGIRFFGGPRYSMLQRG